MLNSLNPKPSTLSRYPAPHHHARTHARARAAQPELVEKLQDPAQNISMENHEFGLPPAHYARWPILNETYDVLSTSKDRCVCVCRVCVPSARAMCAT